MDFKEAKKLIAYARKQGIKSLKVDGIEVCFNDEPNPPPAHRQSVAADSPKPTHSPLDTPELTLQKINEYIYGPGPDESAH